MKNAACDDCFSKYIKIDENDKKGVSYVFGDSEGCGQVNFFWGLSSRPPHTCPPQIFWGGDLESSSNVDIFPRK